MTTQVKVPPMPTRSPDVHLPDVSPVKPPRTLKGDIKALKGKVSSVRSSWSTGRGTLKSKAQETRKDATKILAPMKERIEQEKALADETLTPVYRATEAVKRALDPSNGKTRPYVTSFMISSVVSWVVGPQVLLAAYERIRFHTSTTSWGILHGPGRWFRDTVGAAWETGQTGSLIWAAVLGLTPMIILGVRNMTAGHLAEGTHQGRLAAMGIKWLTRAAYLVPLTYFIGLGYPEVVSSLFGSPWELHWWQIWVMGLFCTAYYCTMWVFDRVEKLHRSRAGMSEEQRVGAKKMGPGLFHALLMTPLASIITGVLLYAPGAAW